jgi:EAL domain-containing protein (putative c-di-GMP-specific phosphodiesterase class I)
MPLNQISAPPGVSLGEFFTELNQYGIKHSGGQTTGNFLGLKLSSVFQPIVHLADHYVLGHQALIRPYAGGIIAIDPEAAFGIALERAEIVNFDRACRTVHMLNYIRSADDRGLLFLSVNPTLLLSVTRHGAAFEKVLHYYSVPTHRVVIKIQGGVIFDKNFLRQVVTNYRTRGYRIALQIPNLITTDAEQIRRLVPDYVELGSGMVRLTQEDAQSRRTLSNQIGRLQEVGTQIALSGIETAEPANIARTIGTNYGIGYFFGKPTTAPEWKPPAH